MMKVPVMLLVALAMAGSASAQTSNTKPAKADKKVCRSAIPTGSIMPKSTCHTKADWDAIDSANQGDAQRNFSRHDRIGGQYGS